MLLIPPAVHQAPEPSLRAELAALLAKDQRGREALSEAIGKHGPFAPEVLKLVDHQHTVDLENVRVLLGLVARYGWPRRSQVGDEAADGAFLVLQHAGPEVQRRLLPTVRDEAARGEVKLGQLALLEDRVLVGEGKPQRYGTQLRAVGRDGLELCPLEEEAGVDARRARMGLGPLADYLKDFGVTWRPKAPAPQPGASR